jgi:hypothetical protein
MDDTKKISQGELLTSSGEPADSGTSGETSASFDFFRPFDAPGHGNFLDRSSGGLQRFHGRFNFWHGRFIGSCILRRRSSDSIPLRVIIITAKEAKQAGFNSKRKKREQTQ